MTPTRQLIVAWEAEVREKVEGSISELITYEGAYSLRPTHFTKIQDRKTKFKQFSTGDRVRISIFAYDYKVDMPEMPAYTETPNLLKVFGRLNELMGGGIMLKEYKRRSKIAELLATWQTILINETWLEPAEEALENEDFIEIEVEKLR